MHGGTHIHTGKQSLLHEERQKQQHLPYSPLSDVIEGGGRDDSILGRCAEVCTGLLKV